MRLPPDVPQQRLRAHRIDAKRAPGVRVAQSRERPRGGRARALRKSRRSCHQALLDPRTPGARSVAGVRHHACDCSARRLAPVPDPHQRLRRAGRLRARMTTPPPAPSRLLPLVGAFNFRDLGGYPTGDGMVTRWGQVFRSDTLNALSHDDLDVLRQLGLRTIVDLRTSNETVRDGRGPLESEPIDYVHLSVLPEEGGETVAAPAPAAAGGNIGDRYLWYLEAGSDALIAALRLVATPAAHPLVFHCTAGKDRTGVLSALLLDCLGVDRATIIDDYMQTEAVLHLILDRLRQHPVYGPQMAESPAPRFGLDASTMAHFLDGVDQRYGGAAGWAKSAGMTEGEIERLRTLLLA